MFSTRKIQGLLCCPNCKGHLDIEVFSRDELGVLEGRMYCSSCEQAYSIKEGILFVEGVVALAIEELVDNATLRIFVDIPAQDFLGRCHQCPVVCR